MTSPHLSVAELACERDGRTLFAGLNLVLSAGEVIELRGPNGSGKTTLLRCLAGLTSDYTGQAAHTVSFLYLGHRGGINGQLTPLENLQWYAALLGIDADAARIRRALDAVGLRGYSRTPCQVLSAGQQRRVTLARLDLGGAPLWLLDEPLTALDDDGCALVRRMLDAHRASGGSAICATHPPLGIAGARLHTLGDV